MCTLAHWAVCPIIVQTGFEILRFVACDLLKRYRQLCVSDWGKFQPPENWTTICLFRNTLICYP